MNRKRNRLEIIRDILKVIKEKSGRIKPTHILYKSNLSHNMMDYYLKELIGKEFIVEEVLNQGKGRSRGRTYSITKKGVTFLEKYRLIAEFTESFGLDVKE
jgi:predicted transcriptional regulator